MCRHWLAERFDDGLEEDPAPRGLVAAAVCAEQVIDLIDYASRSCTFTRMNRADLVFADCGLSAKGERGSRSGVSTVGQGAAPTRRARLSIDNLQPTQPEIVAGDDELRGDRDYRASGGVEFEASDLDAIFNVPEFGSYCPPNPRRVARPATSTA